MSHELDNLHQCRTLAASLVIEGFLSGAECDELIADVDKRELTPATLSYANVSEESRKSEVCWVEPSSASNWLFEKMVKLVEQCNQHYQFQLVGFGEGLQYASYEDGGHFDWHVDLGPNGLMTRRKLSISIQLTDGDDYEGGDLEILNQDMSNSRSRGTAIVFPSYLAHRVTPVGSGQRMAVVAWVHGPSFV